MTCKTKQKICIFLASLSSTTKKHSRSKSSTLPVSGRNKKPSTLNSHHSVTENNNLISSSPTPSKNKNSNNQNQIQAHSNKTNANANSNSNANANQTNSNATTRSKVALNKNVENKNIQNRQIKLNMRPTNFNGQLLTDNLTKGQQRNIKAKKALESK